MRSCFDYTFVIFYGLPDLACGNRAVADWHELRNVRVGSAIWNDSASLYFKMFLAAIESFGNALLNGLEIAA